MSNKYYSVLTYVAMLLWLCGANYAATKTFYLYGAVNSEKAESIRDILSNLKGEDTLVMRIESQGGSVVFRDKIIYYMSKTPAKTLCVVDSYAYSAAASIAFSCKQTIILGTAKFLFHLPHYCEDDDCNKKRILTRKEDSFLYDREIYLLENKYKKYMSKEQVRRFLAGEDVFIYGAQMLKQGDK